MNSEVKLGRYALIVIGVLGATLVPLWAVLPPAPRPAVLLGASLATANTLAAFALARWAAPRSTQAFLWAVLGGMTVRMALVGALVAVAIVALDAPPLPLAVSLLAYFGLFLILELTILARRMPVPEGVAR
jgi:hypothetical protein